MKQLLVILLLMALALPAFGQRVNEEIVTESDIQIRFPGAELPGEDGWYQPEFISVEYSTEPVGEHKDKGRLGITRWEFDIGDGEKAIVLINIPTVPPGFRFVQLMARVSWGWGSGSWAEPSDLVKLIGKPGKSVFIY